MNLREYLRNDFQDYIRPIIVKEECDFCGSSDHLNLHHIDKFHNLLIEDVTEQVLVEYLELHPVI